MNILHISDRDIQGGAARAAFKLHLGLREKGTVSRIWTLQKFSDNKEVIPFHYSKNNFVRLRRRLRQNTLRKQLSKYQSTRPKGFERFSDDRSIYHLEIPDWIKKFDLINLHQVSQILDYKTFFDFTTKNNIPVVWRLADMEPLTGGCHYDWDCNKFTKSCGKCPQLGSDDKNDLSFQVWNRKNNTFREVRGDLLHIVALSSWMAKKIAVSPLLGRFSTSVIPNGVDLGTFKPVCKEAAREQLSLPKNRFILLVLADNLANERKGFDYVVKVLEQCSGSDELFLLLVGNLKDKPNIAVPYMHFEKSLDNRFLAKVYNASDVFLFTSIYDNFPNTVVEAMACGTPSICFDTGGISDIVDNLVNGFKVAPGRTELLVDRISCVIKEPELLKNFSRNCIAKARNSYDLLSQAEKYIELYQKVIESA